MRRTWIAFFLLSLTGCVTRPGTSNGENASSVWFPWPEWTPVAVSLLESTENGMALISAARFGSPRQAFVFAEPKPVPPPAKPDPVPSPADRLPTEYADAGKSVKFAVSADGTPPLTFQWRKDGQPIAGATGAVFAIDAVGLQHAGRYDCIVTNSAGSAASEPFKLVVRVP